MHLYLIFLFDLKYLLKYCSHIWTTKRTAYFPLTFSVYVESKPRPPCLSTPSAVGKKATNQAPVKRSTTTHTPVQQTPSSRPVSHTEPRAPPNSRYCWPSESPQSCLSENHTHSVSSGFSYSCPVVHFVRVVVCKTPGCFLQSLSVPGSSYCTSFKQNKEELTNKLYQLYNTSVFDSKVSDVCSSICSNH